jgi:NADPH:quinone reductase-like Zn-dependent oxidoreductase
MKAVWSLKSGGPDVLEYREIQTPEPKSDETAHQGKRKGP